MSTGNLLPSNSDVIKLLDGRRDFNLDWIKSHGWAVMPTEDHLDPRESEWVSEAARSAGYTTGTAFIVGDDGIVDRVDSVAFEKNRIQELTALDTLRTVLVVPPDLGFAVLLQEDWYNLFAGPRAFVRTAVGCSLTTAGEMFVDWYAKSTRNDKERNSLMRVWQKYEPFAHD